MTGPTFDLVGRIMAYESGEISASDTLELFAHLVSSGQAWRLQGHYGRAARLLIGEGLLTPTGEITALGHERAGGESA